MATLTKTSTVELHQSRALLWALCITLVLVWLYTLGIRTLVPPDEGRYAEMAREMLATGDWITTRLNGIKYFEKPPLQTWMNALTFAAFGLGDWQARLWTGLCALLGIGLTGYTGWRLFGARAGWYAGLVLASSLFWVAAGQINSLDMGLSGMMTVVLTALLLAQRDGATESGRRNWMLLCWAGMALAVLSKGLIGVVLPGAVLVLYTLATRQWWLWSRLHLGKGLLLFFAIAAPWFLLVARANPEQPHFFFVVEHFQRFLTPGHQRPGSWHYFVPLLLIGALPWTAVLLQAMAGALRPAPGQFKPRLMLLIWAVFIFVFFSASSSKLPGYIVPVFPALALLIGLNLETASARGRTLVAALSVLFGVAGLVLAQQMPKYVGRPAEFELLLAYRPWIVAAALVSLGGGALALLWARQAWRRDALVLVLAVSGFASTQLILAGFEAYGQDRAGLALVPKIEAELMPGSVIYSVGTYDQSLPFYLRRSVTLVDYLDEFSFGLQQQPELALPTVAAFVERWSADAKTGPRHVALMREDIYDQLLRSGVPMRLVARDTRRTVVANR